MCVCVAVYLQGGGGGEVRLVRKKCKCIHCRCVSCVCGAWCLVLGVCVCSSCFEAHVVSGWSCGFGGV